MLQQIVKKAFYSACKLLLAIICGESGTKTVNVEFSNGDVSADPKWIYTDSAIRGMLEGKDFDHVGFVFPFLRAFLDREMGEPNRHLIARAHKKFSKLRCDLNCKSMEDVQALRFLNTSQHRIQNLNASLKDTYDSYCETGLYTLKVHILHQVVENLDRFGCLELLSSSAYKNFNVHNERAYCPTFQRHTYALEEVPSAVEVNTYNRRH